MRLLLCSMLLAIAWPAAAKGPAAQQSPTLYAYVGLISGSVQVQIAGSELWTLAAPGQILPAGSQIKTEAKASCTVAFSDQSKVRIGPKATFKVETVTPSKISVFIGLGKLEAWVRKGLNRTFQTRNPVSVASVRGTVFAVNVLTPTNVTVDVFEGAVAVQDNFGNTASVGQGQRVEANAATGASAPAPTPPSVTAPIEPTVTVTPPAPTPAPAPAAAPAKPAAETRAALPPPPPADTVPAEETAAPVAPAPTTNPTQETTTPVSPSSP
jgi:hypothetical protein